MIAFSDQKLVLDPDDSTTDSGVTDDRSTTDEPSTGSTRGRTILADNPLGSSQSFDLNVPNRMRLLCKRFGRFGLHRFRRRWWKW